MLDVMKQYPSINHENVWTLTLPQWWAMAQSIDNWRKKQQRNESQARRSRASRRPTHSRRS